MTNTITQASIDKICRHAGKLAMLIEKAGNLHRAAESDNPADFDKFAMDIAYLWTRKLANDCGDIFKQLYNRQLGA